MVGLAVRPTFQIPIACSKSEAIERFGTAMRNQSPRSLYLAHGEYCEFHLEDHLHRLWSPHLSVYFIDSDQVQSQATATDLDGARTSGQCTLIGRFAPRPNLWTLIWIFYLALFCSIFFATLLGGSQWMIGHFPWGWVIAIATALLYASLWIASQIGQSLCHDQMDLLRNRLGSVLLQADLHPISSAPPE